MDNPASLLPMPKARSTVRETLRKSRAVSSASEFWQDETAHGYWDSDSEASQLDPQFAAVPQVDCGSPNVLQTVHSPNAPKEHTSLIGTRLQDDAVERAIAQLEMTVQACRGQQHRLVPSPDSQARSAPALHLANELIRDDRRHEPSLAERKLLIDSHDGQNVTPPTPISVRSVSSVAPASTVTRSDIVDHDDEGNRVLQTEVLQAEALTLRTELRRADARLQAAIAEETAIRLVMREGDDRHSLRVQELETAIAKLHKDNSRLERSTQQATFEEQRLADVVRSEPVRTDQMLQRLLTECHRLEKENRRIESDTAAIKEELSSVRGVVARDSRRHGPQPRQAAPRRGSLRRLLPWT